MNNNLSPGANLCAIKIYCSKIWKSQLLLKYEKSLLVTATCRVKRGAMKAQYYTNVKSAFSEYQITRRDGLKIQLIYVSKPSHLCTWRKYIMLDSSTSYVSTTMHWLYSDSQGYKICEIRWKSSNLNIGNKHFLTVNIWIFGFQSLLQIHFQSQKNKDPLLSPRTLIALFLYFLNTIVVQ